MRGELRRRDQRHQGKGGVNKENGKSDGEASEVTQREKDRGERMKEQVV